MFVNACLKAFECPTEKKIFTSFVMSLDWNLSFEILCNASGVVLGAVLGQRKERILHPIYYAS